MQQPIIYLITSGATNAQTTPASEEFVEILKLIADAVAAKVSLIQLREKNLSGRVLFELTTQAAQLTRGSQTRLLVNDRADIARAGGADGVHLATSSLSADVVRRTFGPNFLIGVSTHSVAEAQAASATGADFAVWGPVFATESKNAYGEPQGVGKLETVAREVAPFPIIALGGVNNANFVACLEAGASGVAGIGLFQDKTNLSDIVSRINEVSRKNVAEHRS